MNFKFQFHFRCLFVSSDIWNTGCDDEEFYTYRARLVNNNTRIDGLRICTRASSTSERTKLRCKSGGWAPHPSFVTFSREKMISFKDLTLTVSNEVLPSQLSTMIAVVVDSCDVGYDVDASFCFCFLFSFQRAWNRRERLWIASPTRQKRTSLACASRFRSLVLFRSFFLLLPSFFYSISMLSETTGIPMPFVHDSMPMNLTFEEKLKIQNRTRVLVRQLARGRYIDFTIKVKLTACRMTLQMHLRNTSIVS